MISIPTVLPGALGSAAGGPASKSAHGKVSLRGLFGDVATSASFASLFGQQTAALASALQSNAATSGWANSNLLAQLTAQLQSGTPVATIVDQIAQSVGQAAARQLQGKYSPAEIGRLENSIRQTIANALSPPSNAPPGTAAEEAAALAARLRQVVQSLARDANGTGQQNELSGNLLDAISAKDIPAQQKTSGTPSANVPDVSSVVRSLLATALGAIGAPAPSSPVAAASSTAAQTAAASTITVPVPQPAPAVAAQNAVPSSFGTGANAPPGSIAMANAPDLLARMLVRAAGADAAINGAAGPAAVNGPSAQSALPSPSTLAARFAALLGEDATAVAAATGSDTSVQSDASGSNGAGHTFQQAPQTAAQPDTTVAANAAAPGGSSASQVQNALSNPARAVVTVDTSAVIEQLVKGMVMRTDQQGTSEIKLQLQPENLGAVTMRLTVSGSQVSASVVAQNADVRNTIVAGHQELARSLASAGLTLSGFSVDVSGGDAGNGRNGKQTAGFGRRYTVLELNGAKTVSETASDPSSGPPLLGSSSLDLFNYLA